MINYHFWADVLNKFSQLTPWVQLVLGMGFFSLFALWGYFITEIVRAFTQARNNR